MSEAEKKYPYRDMGPRSEQANEGAVSEPETESVIDQGPAAADIKDNVSEGPKKLQQSVFQTPIEASQRAEFDPEIVAQAAAKKLQRESNMQRLHKKKRRQQLVAALVLGIASVILAAPMALWFWFPIIAGGIGVLSGWCIGYFFIDDFWSKFVHAVPQMIWSILGMLFEWQQTGYALMVVAGAWALHFILASFVGMKLQLEERSV